MDTECEEKALLGFPIGEKRSYCPWLVIVSVYYATPFVYVRNSGLVRALGRLLCPYDVHLDSRSVVGVEALWASSLDQTSPLCSNA
eukprot:4060286-Pyramimonas_sp.AAC.2